MTSVAASRVVLVGGFLWLGLALLFSATGAFASLRPPGPQLVILGLTAGVLFAAIRVAAVRAWVDALPLRALVGMHGIRFVGAMFLVLAARSALSPVFAARAGWGDVIAATVALLLVVIGPPNTAVRRWAYLGWNTFGMLDLVLAVSTATIVLLRGDVPGVEPLVRLPLSLVPTFLVPLLFASHIIIFRRLHGGTSGSHER